ncbi:ABC transporter substrate-binding protein [Nocardioides nanhaiensis]|uniref:ABC transporter substrate-binding protein n=1 Tax=Nocardioides nanhaiensis TaxID=1476871 RepID=A0ABP8WI77_9ACTN
MRSSPCPALPTPRPARAAAALALAALTLTACAGAPAAEPRSESAGEDGFPLEITSCGRTTTLEQPVTAGVTLNQGATEVALALGLEDQLTGTAYLDDAVQPTLQQAYEAVPVLAAEYPTQEQLLAAQPDFAYASYASALEATAVGTPAELEQLGVASYLSPFGCAEDADRPAASFDAVWVEVDDVAAAFGVPERAEQLREEQEQELTDVERAGAGEGTRVLWYDSGDKTPYVGAGDGGPQLVLDAVGATNVFGELAGSWADGSWEDVVAADPDVIVLADAAWSGAAEKRAYLERDPVLRELTAVREGRFVTVPFSESTVGVRLVDGAASVAEQLERLAPLEPARG